MFAKPIKDERQIETRITQGQGQNLVNHVKVNALDVPNPSREIRPEGVEKQALLGVLVVACSKSRVQYTEQFVLV